MKQSTRIDHLTSTGSQLSSRGTIDREFEEFCRRKAGCPPTLDIRRGCCARILDSMTVKYVNAMKEYIKFANTARDGHLCITLDVCLTTGTFQRETREVEKPKAVSGRTLAINFLQS